jgi:hypothetical protein
MAGPPPRLTSQLALNAESPREIYDNYGRYMDEESSMARLPWPLQKTTKPPKLPTDYINRTFGFIPVGSVVFNIGSLALDRILDAKLALQAYKGEHRAYPPRLSDLVPRYLSRVPEDPFSDHQPLKYRPTGDKYLLFSIGTDVKDDGGELSVLIGQPGHFVRLFQAEPGYIVAGTNIY